MAATGKILVVDDEPHIRRILQFLLEEEGFEVATAASGAEAVALAAQERPDLVVLDVMMPQMDGFAVLRRLRSEFETSRVPVIMLTARGDSAAKVRGLREGANDYLAKPFNQEELLLRLRNMLEADRAQREANPLTGLPGNHAIERETLVRARSGQPFAVMYVDIDRFKSFNDHYGYQRGDQAISFLARVLRDCSRAAGGGEFVGHVGGDDFVVLSGSDGAEDLARSLLRAFDRGVVDLHDEVDLERGYLEVENRAGVREQVPLITVTVALVVDARAHFQHPAELGDTLAELKRFGKLQVGSVVVRERRSPRSAHEVLTGGTSEQDES
ncbi:MAG: response regulator [Candidatus Krumholzibacteriia bacterium]